MKDLRIIVQVFLLFAGTFMAEIRTLADNTQMEKDIIFSQISIQDGLSQSTVLSITQDSKGHMWFATHDGLNRYDGYEFTIYRHNPEDSTTIADNIIRKVYIDEFDKLWIGTESGLSYYDRTLDQFRNFNTDGKSVTSICGMPDGKILVAAGGELNIFDSHTKILNTDRKFLSFYESFYNNLMYLIFITVNDRIGNSFGNGSLNVCHLFHGRIHSC